MFISLILLRKVMDRISIVDSKVFCRIGITPEEREKDRDLLVSIALYASIAKAARTDSIDDTVSYSEVNKVIQRLANHQYNLIETYAEKIARTVLAEYAVQMVEVFVKKSDVPRGASYAGVCILRNRSDYDYEGAGCS
jgi:dihydroneopterin aldolase